MSGPFRISEKPETKRESCDSLYNECISAMGPVRDEWIMGCLDEAQFISGVSLSDCALLIEADQEIDRIAAVESTPRAAMDLDRDGDVILAEAMAYAVSRESWERDQPTLDLYGLKTPIDVDHFSPAIFQRIHDIAFKVESELGIERDAQGFCEAFLPAFIEAGKESFQAGGLCLGYTEEPTISIWEEPEMTASEAFEICEDPTRQYGSCTEMTYKVIGAVRAAGIPCDVTSMLTENHAYPAYDGVSLDPSGIGEIGWSRETDPAAIYLDSVAGKNSDKALGQMASLLEPKAFADYSNLDLLLKVIRGAYENNEDEKLKLEIVNAFLSTFDSVVLSNPKTIGPFNNLGTAIYKLPPAARFDVGLACISRWPENPYASIPLNTALFYEEDAAAANKGDQDALYRLGQKERSIADRIRKEIDEPLLANGRRATGFADIILAQVALQEGRNKEAFELVRKALAKNPDNATAHQTLAYSYAAELRYDECKSELNKSISLAPNISGNHMLLAQIAQIRGDLEEASIEAQKEAIVFVGNQSAAMLAVTLENSGGHPRKALELLNLYFPSKYIDATSKVGFEMSASQLRDFRLGQTAAAYQIMGRYDKARRFFNELRKREGKDAAWTQALLSLELDTQNIKAVKTLYAEVAENMNSPMKHIFNASLAFAEDDLPRLEEELRIIKAMPGIEATYVNQISLSHALMTGDYGKARELTAARVEANPKDLMAGCVRTQTAIEEGRTVEARKKYEELKKEYPDVFVISSMEPYLLMREERYGEALRTSEKLRKTSGPLPFIEIMRGFSLSKIGRPKEALEIGRRIKKLLPKNTAGALIMARALLEMGEAEKAKALLPEIKQLQKYNIENWPLMSSSALEKEIEAALARR